MQRVVGRARVLRAASIGTLAQGELLLLSGHKDRDVVRVLRRVRRGRESLLTGNETFVIHSLARTQAAMEGDMAEVGVYQGCSARLICEAKGERPLHLFDTFEGLPEPAEEEKDVLKERQFSASLDRVRRYLAGYPNVSFHPGLFPASAGQVVDRRFSLVHLDVDLYESTRAGLAFFYPRLVPRGVIVVHDFSILPGVRRAVAEFVQDVRPWSLELPTTQIILMRADARAEGGAAAIEAVS